MPRFIPIPRLRRGRATVAADVDAEIRSHLDERIRGLVEQGMTPDDARREALRRFGDVETTRRLMRHSARRHEDRLYRHDVWHAISHDARHTLRQLRRAPALTTAIVVTLALGIGATATMFGVVDRLLLRPPPHVRDPGRLGRLYVSHLDGPDLQVDESEVSHLRYRELRDAARPLADVAAMGDMPMVAGTGAAARRVSAALVSANFWALVGVRPAFGRFFRDEEDEPPDGTNVVVLGHAYWRTAFGEDSTVIGRPIDLGARRFTIIGVTPPDFHGVKPGRVDVWLPVTTIRARETGMPADWYAKHNMWWLEMVVRLRPEATGAQLQAALTPAFARSFISAGVDSARARERARVAFGPLLQERGPQREDTTRVATWLAIVAGIVLLLACTNVANLLLARAIHRRREIAVRVALGVRRGRLLGQLLVESLILALCGAAVGVALTLAGGRVLHPLLLSSVAPSEHVFDGRIMAFAVLAALAAGVLAGLAPAVHATRRDVATMLRGSWSDGGHQRSRLRTLLLVGQAALSTMLLVGAGLFIRSLENARATQLGFEARHLVVVRAEIRDAVQPPGGTSSLYRRFSERLRTLPGVVRATTTIQIPFSVSGSTNIFVPGLDSAAVERMGRFRQNPVGLDYFETMGTRILQGRALNASDRAGSPLVMVVSDSMARSLWPGQSALGRCVKVGESTQPCSLVVGIAENIHQYEVRPESALQYWFPEGQNQGGSSGAFAAVARVSADPKSMVPGIRTVLQPLAPANTFVSVSVVGDALDRVVRPWRLGAIVLAVFGLLGLCIAALGLYSVLAFTVSQRTAEMGLRMALGARTANVLRIVVQEGVRTTLMGVVLGMAIALGAGRSMATLLFGVTTTDPIVLILVVATLLATALVASAIPAWRASRVDPIVALRAE